jgi:hypothetical protein
MHKSELGRRGLRMEYVEKGRHAFLAFTRFPDEISCFFGLYGISL